MEHWPSLVDHGALAEQLFGQRGRHLLAAWLAVETARIDDPKFAREFADHVELPGIVPGDFNHRRIGTSNGDLLGGIRFRRRDIRRPFVDVFCHGFDDLGDLCDSVRSAWSEFSPGYLRIHALPSRVSGPGVLLDQTVHAARYRDMPPSDPRVSLHPFPHADEAIAIVAGRYERLASDDPELRRNVSPRTADDLRDLHADDRLRAIRVGDVTVGALAVAPGSIAWIDGDEIQEEVVDIRHRGKGYATAAQCVWARSVTDDPDRLLIGTIDRLNNGSRTSAERAGRSSIMEAVFVSLRP